MRFIDIKVLQQQEKETPLDNSVTETESDNKKLGDEKTSRGWFSNKEDWVSGECKLFIIKILLDCVDVYNQFPSTKNSK